MAGRVADCSLWLLLQRPMRPGSSLHCHFYRVYFAWHHAILSGRQEVMQLTLQQRREFILKVTSANTDQVTFRQTSEVVQIEVGNILSPKPMESAELLVVEIFEAIFGVRTLVCKHPSTAISACSPSLTLIVLEIFRERVFSSGFCWIILSMARKGIMSFLRLSLYLRHNSLYFGQSRGFVPRMIFPALDLIGYLKLVVGSVRPRP